MDKLALGLFFLIGAYGGWLANEIWKATPRDPWPRLTPPAAAPAPAPWRTISLHLYSEPYSPVWVDQVLTVPNGQFGWRATIMVPRDGYVHCWTSTDSNGKERDVTPPMWQDRFIKAGTAITFRLSTAAMELKR